MAAVVEDIPEQEGPNSRMCKLCRRFRKASDTAPDGRYAWETVKSVVIHTEVKSPMDSSENRVTAEALPLLELQVTWGRLPASSESQRVFCDPSLERSTACPQHAGDFACGRPRHLALAR